MSECPQPDPIDPETDNVPDVHRALWQRIGRVAGVVCAALCLVGAACLVCLAWSFRDVIPVFEITIYVAVFLLGWVFGYFSGFSDGVSRRD